MVEDAESAQNEPQGLDDLRQRVYEGWQRGAAFF